ncbi:hypothetical protein JOF59_000973 [Streptomyces clavifer]|uniref:Uncharacterized protein n=1 Tax=Streptomyces clavifer TaxID=68188 RepID=A0ABS4V3T8_9ACTN|nr:hypothetical protein ASD26_22455 [Streptomyces sp. Root1319]MBP2358573.1 hypothetical protein [Streptomyces clavifer]
MSGALEPGQQVVGIPDGGGQADPLERAPGDACEPFQYGQQMPASVVTGEGVDFVDDDAVQAAEEGAVVDMGTHQHGFQRFRGGEQDVGPLGQDAAPP